MLTYEWWFSSVNYTLYHNITHLLISKHQFLALICPIEMKREMNPWSKLIWMRKRKMQLFEHSITTNQCELKLKKKCWIDLKKKNSDRMSKFSICEWITNKYRKEEKKNTVHTIQTVMFYCYFSFDLPFFSYCTWIRTLIHVWRNTIKTKYVLFVTSRVVFFFLYFICH